jgi:hypothetical protein
VYRFGYFISLIQLKNQLKYRLNLKIMSTSKFRSKIWDPLLLSSQIISLQFQFYTSMLILNYFLSRFVHFAYDRNYDGTENTEFTIYSLEQIFDHRLVNFHNANNTFICFAYILNSLLR